MQTIINWQRLKYIGAQIGLYLLMVVISINILGLNRNETTLQAAPVLPLTSHQPVAKSSIAPIATGIPARITIPSLSIDLVVLDGAYNAEDGSWTLSDNYAHFALPSTILNNQEGNTLIYGHNTWQVFAALDQLAVGDLVYVESTAQQTFVYRYSSAEDFSPQNTDIFSYRGAPRLTLQTCTGIWNELRRMYVLDFVQVR